MKVQSSTLKETGLSCWPVINLISKIIIAVFFQHRFLSHLLHAVYVSLIPFEQSKQLTCFLLSYVIFKTMKT